MISRFNGWKRRFDVKNIHSHTGSADVEKKHRVNVKTLFTSYFAAFSATAGVFAFVGKGGG